MKKRIVAIVSILLCLTLAAPMFSIQVNAATSVKKGIDVSTHQGNINWTTVKSQIDFAIIRCGYGGNSTSQDDSKWAYNVSECERLGIPYGVYLYSYATTDAKASSEAAHAIRLLQGHTPSLPVFYDLEDEDTTGKCSNAQILSMTKIFCNAIQNAGYTAGVYASLYWWNNKLTSSDYDSYVRWVAQYNSSCSYKKDYKIWQYSSKGSVSGISGNVDMNYLYGDFTVSVDTTAPVISSVTANNISSSGYDVTCNFSDDTAVTKLVFYTWTVNGGQDDMVSSEVSVSGSSATYRVNVSDHGNQTNCNYTTHVYAFDRAGNMSNVATTGEVAVSAPVSGTPVFSNWRVTNISASGYTVQCDVSNYVSGYDVLCATWTIQSGQDDLTWNTAGKSGNTFSYRVSVSDHNNEVNCKYTTHLYYRYNNALTIIGSVGEFIVGDYKTVTYDANGGTGAPIPQSFYGAAELSTTVPAKTNQVTFYDGTEEYDATVLSSSFLGWNTNSSGTGTNYSAGASYYGPAATLYAKWYNPTLQSLPTPQKEGFTFNGWYTSSSGGSAVSTGYTVNGNVSLYARWTAVASSNFTSEKFSTAPTIDGVINDAEWSGSAVYYFGSSNLRYYSINNALTSITRPNSSSITKIGESSIRFGWDSNNLYIAGTIADSTTAYSAKPVDDGGSGYGYPRGASSAYPDLNSGMHEVGDAVTVILRTDGSPCWNNDDPGAGKEKTVALTFHAFPLGARGEANRACEVRPEVSENFYSLKSLNLNTAVTATENGYTFEYAIPKSVLAGLTATNDNNQSFTFAGADSVTNHGQLYFSVILSDGDGNVNYSAATGTEFTNRYTAVANMNEGDTVNGSFNYIYAAHGQETKKVTFIDNTVSETARIAGATLTLGTDLSVNYYCTLPGDNYRMRFTRGESASTAETLEGVLDSSGYYIFSYHGINPQCMNDNIRAEIVDASGNTVAEMAQYSVRQYCENMYAKYPNDTSLLRLMADLLNYGRCAQIYMGHNSLSLGDIPAWVSANMTQEYVAPSDSEKVKSRTQNADASEAIILSSNAVLGYTNYIEFKVFIGDGYNPTITLTADGTRVDYESYEDGTYLRIRTPAISVLDFAKVFRLKLASGRRTLSLVDYNFIAYVISKGATTDSTGFADLVRSLYNYSVSARLYNN